MQGKKREQIMAAAEKLFTNRRFHEITLEQVAACARVGKGTIYRYFEDKDDLFFQVATSGFAELCDLLRESIPPGACFRDKLVTAALRISDFHRQRKQLMRMMQSEEGRLHWLKGRNRERWLSRRRELLAALAEIFVQGVAEGAIRPELDCEILATFFLGMLRTRGRGMDTAEEVSHEQVVDLFLHGADAGPR